METLDNLIFDEIKKLSLDPDYITQLQPTKKKDDLPKEIDKKIAEIEKQLSKLMELYSLDGISLEVLQKKISELNTNKLKLSEEKTRILLDEEQELTKDEALRLINSFDAILEAGSMPEIRAILQALIDKIEIDGDDITIFWKFI
jgi:site-specific DNA recombinase